MKILNLKIIGVLLIMMIMISSSTVAMTGPSNKLLFGIGGTSTEEILTYSFTFIKPCLQTVKVAKSQYTNIHMPGCIAIGKAGEPAMPVKSVKLLIPPMKKVTSINLIGTPVELTSIEKPVFPYQKPVPIGSVEPQDFEINNELYSSDLLYPSSLYDEYHIGYCRGYTIFDVTFNTMQYIPNQGKLVYYPRITLTIELEDTTDVNHFYRDNTNDKEWAKMLVYNPEIADRYTTNIPIFGYPGGLCDPSEDYDYAIVTTTHNSLDYWPTSDSIPYNWESLIDKHAVDDSLNCKLVTIQDIKACVDYYNPDKLFNDTEARVREFCKDAYQDWGIEYILIGGDDEWIPAREMDTSYEYNINSDIYWNHLDSTFNEDHDHQWGEEGDPGFDLYSELYIGRITCDTPQDVSNWLKKSFYYADSNFKDYLENAAFYGGCTTWPCQGDDFIDYSAIKGTDSWLGPYPDYDPYPSWLGFNYGFETWNALNPGIFEYNLSVKWTAEPPNPGWRGGSEYVAIEGLRNAINNDQCTLISAIAHANQYMSMDVYDSSWESDYHNTKPFFIHDYGCHCGDMDAADDGVLHSMLFHSDTELAFGCVYNTGFGWGNYYCTNSSSAMQQKLFWDYFFDVINNSDSPDNWQLGKAMAYSKDIMASTIYWIYSYSWRSIIQGCLLFGDPAQRLKPPFRDIEPPYVEVIKPEKAIYINDNKILPFFTTVIIRDINIDVDASDNISGIDRVEFYIDDGLKHNTTELPYSWTWTWDKNSFLKLKYTIKVIVYDTVGNSDFDEITVWKFL